MLLSHMLLNIVCAPLSHFWLQHPEMTLCHAAFEIRITLQNRQQCDVDLNMSGMVLTGLLSWLSAAIASKLQQHVDLDATAEASTEQQICSPSERWIPTECLHPPHCAAGKKALWTLGILCMLAQQARQ